MKALNELKSFGQEQGLAQASAFLGDQGSEAKEEWPSHHSLTFNQWGHAFVASVSMNLLLRPEVWDMSRS